MKKSNGYHECKSDDLDPFQDCKPVNCELKYFGKRNFFDGTQCVPATLCDKITPLYDYETNECRSIRKVLSDDEIREMLDGKFTNWSDATAEDLKDVEPVGVRMNLRRFGLVFMPRYRKLKWWSDANEASTSCRPMTPSTPFSQLSSIL